MDQQVKLLEDPSFIFRVLLQGELKASKRVSSLDELVNILNETCKDILCFFTVTAGPGQRLVGLYRGGRIVDVYLEGSDRHGLDVVKDALVKPEGVLVSVYAVPQSLIEEYEELKNIAAAAPPRIEAPKTPPPIPAVAERRVEEIPTATRVEARAAEEVRKAEAAAVAVSPVDRVKELVDDLKRYFLSLDLELRNVVAVQRGEGIVVGVSTPLIRIRAPMAAWLILLYISRVAPELLDKITRVRVIDALSPAELGEEFEFSSPLSRTIALSCGKITEVILRNNLDVETLEARIDPASNIAEFRAQVKPHWRREVVTSEMLGRVAVECLREVQPLWPGFRLMVRLRSGRFTEGRAST